MRHVESLRLQSSKKVANCSALLGLCFGVLLWLAPAIVAAQGQPSAPAAPPAQVQDLLRLLDDPAVQGWLKQQRAVPAPIAGTALANIEADVEAGESMIAERLAFFRANVAGLVAASSRLGAEMARLGALVAPELQAYGFGYVLLLIAAFISLGFGVEWVFWNRTRALRKHIIARPLETRGDRLRVIGLRLAFGLGWVGAFAVGSIGAFLAFPWPPLLREIVLTYLQVFLIIRLTMVLGRFVLAPGAPRSRIVPMDDISAQYWHRWLAVLIGWFFFARFSMGLLARLGTPAEIRSLNVACVALVWLGLSLTAVWQRPPRFGKPVTNARTVSWLLTAFFVLIWLFTFIGAYRLFWFGLLAVLVPILLRLIRESATNLLRPEGAANAPAGPASIVEVCVERGLRAAVIIGAIYLLAGLWDIRIAEIAARDTLATRLMVGALNALVIILIAEFIWHLAKAVIDGRVAAAATQPDLAPEEMTRRSRVRTLLPIIRNMLFILILAMTILMALSQLGVEIGPLIAGAGVLGVAIGFGAQTVVKDVISGMFYLLDDAFRVGEYIQSGNYKGTVESFSLRSVKLRHHRGPLYTVPFGTLGAIQNMSRDWVIEKMTVGLTYDTDIAKVKKIIKKIGEKLLEDPEFKPHIIETLKMQGVESFGDSAIQFRMKMMTKPGEQFSIRRSAFAMIKKAFDAEGIKFAFPTVQVAGGGPDANAVIARQALDLVKAKAEPAS